MDSKIINWVRFPLSVMIIVWHTQRIAVINPAISIWNQGFSPFIYALLSGCITWVAVPSFFFISGYLFFSKLNNWDWNGYLSKIEKRVTTLFIPYLLWISIYLVYQIPWIIHSGAPQWFNDHGWLRIFWDNNRLGENIDTIYNIIGVPMHHGFPLLTPMWYLRDLMIVCLLSPIVYLLVKYAKGIGLILVAFLMCLNIWIPFEGFSAMAFFFFSWGAYYRVNNKSFTNAFQKYNILSIVLVFITVYLVMFFYTDNHLVSSIARQCYTIFGVVAIFNIARRLLKYEKIGKLSESTFFLYASHIMVMGLWSIPLVHYWPFKTDISYAISYFLIIVLTIITTLLLYRILKNNIPKLLSILSGGR